MKNAILYFGLKEVLGAAHSHAVDVNLVDLIVDLHQPVIRRQLARRRFTEYQQKLKADNMYMYMYT